MGKIVKQMNAIEMQMKSMKSRKRTVLEMMTEKVMEIALSIILMVIFHVPLLYVVGLSLLIELSQMSVHYINDRFWAKSTWEMSHEGHFCEPDKCKIPNCLCPYHKEFKKVR